MSDTPPEGSNPNQEKCPETKASFSNPESSNAPEYTPAAKGGSSLLKKLIPLGVIAVALGAIFFSGIYKQFAPDQLFTTLEGFRAWIDEHKLLAVLAMIATYALLVAVSFPSASLLTIGSGFLFGQWYGTFAAFTGAFLGSLIIFMMAKTIFGDALASKAGGFVKKMEKGFREDELNYMFLLRLVPAFPFFAVNIGAGLLNVKTRNYALGTFFGILPGSFVYVSIGNAIRAGTKTLGDTSALSLLTQPAIYIPFIGLAALGALPIIIKRFGGKKTQALAQGDASND